MPELGTYGSVRGVPGNGHPYRDHTGLHSPEQSPAGAVPANHRCRLHDHQRAAPIEEPGQERQADASRRVDPVRLDTALDVQSQLPAQEEILGAQGLGRSKQEQQPPEGVFDEKTCDPQEADHALIVPQRSAVSQRLVRGRDGWNICGAQGTKVQGHGLRATFARIAEELVSSALLKRMMNHAAAGDVTLGHYVAKSEAQLRAGWRAVADFVDEAARKV
jgi:hypothetical protein